MKNLGYAFLTGAFQGLGKRFPYARAAREQNAVLVGSSGDQLESLASERDLLLMHECSTDCPT
jgi:short-subunit dehydrogenase